MNFRFTLSHESLGDLVINEPDGWKDAVLKLERHPEFHSLVEYFESSFIFYGTDGRVNGGISYLLQAEELLGPDAEINILSEISFDSVNYDTVYSGQLDLWELNQFIYNKMQVPIIPTGFWANFINRKDTPVNLQSETGLDGTDRLVYDSVNLRMTGQKLNKRIRAENRDDQGIEENLTTGQYLQCDWDYTILEELKEKYNLPILPNAELPAWIYEPTERGLHTFDIKIYSTALGVLFGIVFESVKSINDLVDFYVQKNDDTPIAMTWQDIIIAYYDPLDTITEFSYSNSIFLEVGDVVRVYGRMNDDFVGSGFAFFLWNSNRPELTSLGYTSYFDLLGVTEYPDTNAESFLLHDAAMHITDRIIGQDNTFYSEYLGSTQTVTRQYDTDGCGWKNVLLKGLQIRQYSLIEKPFFLSFMNWWNGANPIFNLGLTYEERGTTIDQVIPNAFFNNSGYWENVGSGTGWIISGGNADSNIVSGSSKFFESLVNTSTQAGNYTYSFTFSITNVPGKSASISVVFLKEDGTSAHGNSLSTAGANLINQTLSSSFTSDQRIKRVRFFSQVLSGTDIDFSVHEFTLNGPTLGKVIRVEQKEYFYDDSSVSVNFSNVRDIARTYDKDHIFNLILSGFTKWESEDISGIDDPQTKHTYATIFKKAAGDDGNGGRTGTLNLYSSFVAASLAIETTRRQTKEKSADYKFDNDTFIVAINPEPVTVTPETSPEVTDYVPELDENFASISNLLNSDTRYNVRLTPARTILRWLNYISGCLFKNLSSDIMFQSGEGNYDVETDLSETPQCDSDTGSVLSEKQGITPESDFLFIPLAYEIVIPMSWEQYKAIRDNHKMAIGISQTTSNHIKFFIKTLSYEIVKGRATIIAWPKSLLQIAIIENTFALRDCEPGDAAAEECIDGITDDALELLTTDTGECITT